MATKTPSKPSVTFTEEQIEFLRDTLNALPLGDPSASGDAEPADGLGDLDRAELKQLIEDEDVELAVKKATTEDEMREAIRSHRASLPPGAEVLNGESDAEPADGLGDLDRAELKQLIEDEDVELAVKKATTEDEMREAIRAKRSNAEPAQSESEDTPAEGPTQDEVRDALKKLVIKDKELAKKLLAKYKAKSLPELDEAHYVKVIAEALKLAK